VLTGLLGLGVGAGELISRYRDAPSRAIFTAPAVVYMLVNAGAALVALALIREFGWTFGASPEGNQIALTQILVAGFGAMALFRSALFVVRVGNQDVGVGPNSFLQILLTACDSAVDRLMAQARASEIKQIMNDISFEKASGALPTLCFALMQNLPSGEQARFAEQLVSLKSADMSDHAKALSLGIAIINLVGRDVLESAIVSLGNEIRITPIEAAPSPTPAPATGANERTPAPGG
jgi:hypothetical protein